MARIERLNELKQILKAKGREAAKSSVSVVVGYTQNYALAVHERTWVYHPNGQAKFLEEPFRSLAPEMKALIAEDMKGGMTMEQALLRQGLRLQRESQELVPVDTGALKGSAFTRVERGQ